MRLGTILTFGLLLVGASRASGQDAIRVSTKALMTVDQFRTAGLETLSPAELSSLERWIGRFVESMTKDVSSVARRPELVTPRAIQPSLEYLEGGMIVADDGEPLGLITTNCFKADAVCNEFGRYGNQFNGKSMLNEFGPYGNAFNEKSPF